MAELTRLQMARAAERALREIVSEGYFGSDQHELVLDALDALATVEAGSEWMPIDSVPAEGEFLVYLPGERLKVQAAVFRAGMKVIGGRFAYDISEPSHYMLQPKPPAITAAPAEGGGARGAV